MTDNLSDRMSLVPGTPIDFDNVGKQYPIENRKEDLHPIFTEARYPTSIPVDPDNKTANILLNEIEKNRQIPYSRFMEISLYGEDGYYSRGKVQIGKGKDFVTSPELSQIFGWGVCLAGVKLWNAMNRPSSFHVMEQGAGQASLSHAFLELAASHYPDFYDSLNYTIVELGDDLIPLQQSQLRDYNSKVKWINESAYDSSFGSIDGLIISNELPDAFPVERCTKIESKIKQKYVAIEDNTWVEVWDTPSDEVLKYIREFNISIEEGVEEPINLHALQWMKSLGVTLNKGGILTFDYGEKAEVGHWNRPAVQFYGKSDERKVANEDDDYMFAAYRYPGNVDITTLINFSPLETIASELGFNSVFAGYQKDFLLNIGIAQLLKEKIDSFRHFTSWQKVTELEKSLGGYEDIMYLAGHYFAQFLIKDTPASAVQWGQPDKDYRPILPKIPIQIDGPYEEVLVDMKKNKKWKNYSDLKFPLQDRILMLFPNQIEGSLVYSPDGKDLLLDLSKPDVAKIAIESAGFQYGSEA